MSDLKHLTKDELDKRLEDTNKYIAILEKRISFLKSKISGQNERIKWINKYKEKIISNEKFGGMKCNNNL